MTDELIIETANPSYPLSGHDRDARRQNIAALRALGVDPFPQQAWNPTHELSAVLLHVDDFRENNEKLRLAGRVTSLRGMGKVMFLDLSDQGKRLQLYISRHAVADLTWKTAELLDIGDFIGIEGHIFVTKRGERSLNIDKLVVLGKPTKGVPIGKRDSEGVYRSAMSDKGLLLRNRHIDLLVNPVLRERIVMRDLLLREVRAYFQEENFIEIETPSISRAYGGAAATPFRTESKVLDAPLYLRVSPECSLKQALCGGINRVFEIGKNFRNEGIDASHNPEFTAIEWYEAWSDYVGQMCRFEQLVARLARRISGNGIIHFRGRDIDFNPPWPRQRMVELVAEHLELGEAELTVVAMAEQWQSRGLPAPAPTSWGSLIVGLFEECVQQTLIGPTFIIDHPVEGSPLTKHHRTDPRFVERFEPYVMGMEIGNAYSELNDADEQRRRLVEQDDGRDEAYGLDEQFLNAIEDGMPQAGGAGLGLDRIFMILTGAQRLSDVILFPMT